MTSADEQALARALKERRRLKIELALLQMPQRTDSVDEVTAWVRGDVPDATHAEIGAAFDRLMAAGCMPSWAADAMSQSAKD